MLISVLPVPFADAGHQRQYEAVLAALEAEADAPATVLLGNLGAFSPIQADVLVMRPTGLALGILLPQAGLLSIPALASGAWLLDGQPLPDSNRTGSDNPFAQYQRQLPSVLAWVGEQLSFGETALLPRAGLALFDEPLTFGPDVEAQVRHHAAAHDFQLVDGAAQVPGRLRQLFASSEAVFTEEELLDWTDYLANASLDTEEPTSALNPANFLEQKLRQLWRWLGAEDIPADPPYGAPPLADQHLRDQQEQARLQQLRQELRAELHQQRQEATAREAARTQELALLRQQLAQAGPSPTAREAEQRAKEAVEESLRTARADLATRNAELDARIQQLGQLIGRLQAAPGTLAATVVASTLPVSVRPPSALAAPVPATAAKPQPTAAPQRAFRRLRQAERWGVVALVAAGVGVGTWGVVRWAHRPAPHPAAMAAPRQPDETSSEDYAPAEPDDMADSLARQPVSDPDTLARPATQNEPAAPEADAAETLAQPAALHVDSAAVIVKPTPLLPGAAADSAAAPNSTTP